MGKNPNFIHTDITRNFGKDKNKNNNNNNITTAITINSTDNDSNDDGIFVPPPLYNPLNETDYKHGVELLHRFTYVLDIQCLDEGMIELATQLKLNVASVNATIQASAQKINKGQKTVTHSTSNLERI